jgi:hypothetical protein
MLNNIISCCCIETDRLEFIAEPLSLQALIINFYACRTGRKRIYAENR